MMCLFIDGGASASAENELGAAVATETGGQVSNVIATTITHTRTHA